MNKLFNELILESAIEFEKLKRDIFVESAFPNHVIIESADGEGFFDRIITKIREIVKSVKDKLQTLFKHEKIDKAVKTIETAKKENPKITTMTITTVDYDKLQKLNNDTAKILVKDNCDVEAEMKKYRSQRNKILAASAAVTITLAGALYLVTKNRNEKISELDKLQRETESRLNTLKGRYTSVKRDLVNAKDENTKLKNENERLKQKTIVGKAKVVAKQTSESINKSSDKTARDIAHIKSAVSAQAEVLQNATTDTLHQVQDAVKTLADGEASIFKKVKSVTNIPSSAIKNVTNVANGTQKKEVLEKRLSDIKEKRDSYKNKIENAKKILNSDKASKEQKEKAKRFLDEVPKYLDALKKEYGAVKAQMN